MSNEKVLLITGASSGIGAATARRAHAAGFKLVLGARSEDKLKALADELGGDVAVGRCDVTAWEELEALVRLGTERFGRLDACFANAGIGGSPGGFSGADRERWKQMILTNVWGLGLTLQACLPAIKESRGHVLINGSVAGRRTLGGSMYSATSELANPAIQYESRTLTFTA